MTHPCPARGGEPNDPAKSRVSLSSLPPGSNAVVRHMTGGRGIAQRLASMGLLPGRELKVLRNWGSMIVKLQGNRLVLGRGVAQHVQVETRPEGKK